MCLCSSILGRLLRDLLLIWMVWSRTILNLLLLDSSFFLNIKSRNNSLGSLLDEKPYTNLHFVLSSPCTEGEGSTSQFLHDDADTRELRSPSTTSFIIGCSRHLCQEEGSILQSAGQARLAILLGLQLDFSQKCQIS